jgi:DNA-binding beta-propeller fold protein YncE/PKD repeat protein
VHVLRKHIEEIPAIGRVGRRGVVRLAALVALLALGAVALIVGTQVAAGAVYVANLGSESVSAFSIGSGGSLSAIAGSPFATGREPLGVVVSPDGRHVYVTNLDSESVSAFSIASNGSLHPVAGSPFTTGYGPWGVAVSPDGNHLYVANNNRGSASGSVSAFSIASNGSLSPVAGSPFTTGGEEPTDLAVSPDSKHLYVADQSADSVSAFSIASNGSLSAVPGSPFATEHPRGVAVTPDSRYLYVVNESTDTVSAFSIASNGSLSPVSGSPFAAGYGALGVAVTPDGKHLYTANSGSGENVSAFSIAVNGSLSPVSGSPFATGGGRPGGPSARPNSVAVSRDGKHLYVTNYGSNNVSAFSISSDGSLSRVAASPFATGEEPLHLATGPDLSPVAAFSATPEPARSASSFDASASSDPDGAVVSYSWEFGDGQTQITPTASTTHTYAAAGDYTVTLTVTSEAGCSTTQISSGQTVICNGSPLAKTSQQVIVPTPAALNVSVAGPGSGTLTSSPSGIACPGMCSHAYATGTQVTLAVTPAAGSTFAGWSGGGCSGTGTCQVTMNADTSVTATFSKVSSTPPPPNETPLSSLPQQTRPPLTPNETSPPPLVQNAHQSAARWREGNQLARISRGRTPTGTTFSFSLNEQAHVSFSFTRLLGGPHGADRCLARAHANVQRKSCNSTVTRGTLSFTGHSGTNNVVFAGRISRTNKLKPGRYELIITATNSTGQRSAPVSLSFTIAR